MDVHQLEYFLAVRDHGSINAAAHALGITQPTISQSIKNLEREMGVHLFHRIGRGMALTSAGHALAGPARQVLRDISVAESSLYAHENAYRGTLQIAVFPALATGVVSELVARLHQRVPKALITVEDIRDESSAATLLRDGHVEIVVMHLAPTDAADGVEHHDEDRVPDGLGVIQLGRQEFWLVVPDDFADRLPDHDPIGWGEIPDMPMVIVPRGGSHAGEIERALAREGTTPLAAATVEQREALRPLVRAGVGATFIERSIAEKSRGEGVAVRALDPALSRPFGLLYDPESLSTAGRILVELATDLTSST